MSMNIESAAFGGIRVDTPNGVIAVNAGGNIDEMDRFYLSTEKPLIAMVMTCEHQHRSRNAEAFAEKHGVPLIGSFIVFAHLRIHAPEKWEVFPTRKVVINRMVIDLFHVKYDSVDPLALTVSVNDESIGIVPDGKLTDQWNDALQKLYSCQKVFFSNKMDHPTHSSEILFRRYRSCYNSSSELMELFRDYRGEIIIDPYCH